jgi:CheY-like chemotaxis protein
MGYARFYHPPAALVIEDEPLIRMIAAETVEEAGFTALEAENADKAIGLLEQRQDIRILFTDVNMPGAMDGLKLAHYVHDRWPEVKIIVTSGRSRLRDEELPPGGVFLNKPYSLGRLTRELRVMAANMARRAD